MQAVEETDITIIYAGEVQSILVLTVHPGRASCPLPVVVRLAALWALALAYCAISLKGDTLLMSPKRRPLSRCLSRPWTTTTSPSRTGMTIQYAVEVNGTSHAKVHVGSTPLTTSSHVEEHGSTPTR